MRKLFFLTVTLLPFLTACSNQAVHETPAQIRQRVGSLTNYVPGNPNFAWDGCGELNPSDYTSYEDGYCISTFFVQEPFDTPKYFADVPIGKYLDPIQSFNVNNAAKICSLATNPKMMGYDPSQGVDSGMDSYITPKDPTSFIRGCEWGIKVEWPLEVSQNAPAPQQSPSSNATSDSGSRVRFDLTADFPTKVNAGETFMVKVTETPYGPSTCQIYNSGGQNRAFSGTGLIKNTDYKMTSGNASIPVLALQPGAAEFEVDCSPDDPMSFIDNQLREDIYIAP